MKSEASTGRAASKGVNLYGVAKLRGLILDLAVRGSLTEHNPSEESAVSLLKRVLTDREQLIEAGRFRKPKKLEAISDDEIAYQLPEGWTWVKLGQLMEMFNGRAFKKTEWSEAGVPIIRIQNLNDPSVEFNHFDGELAEQHQIQTGDFLISWSGTPGTSFGAFIWERGEAALNQHINKCWIFGEEINRPYLRLAVNSCMDHLIAQAHGAVGLKHVTKDTLNNTILALPPLPEQMRIVDKVDELMLLCDQLEAQQADSIEAHKRLVTTLLDAFTKATEQEGFGSAWARIADHFDVLYTTEWSVDQLKQTILQLAVMGKLAHQDEAEEPSALAIERGLKDREVLIAAGKMKRPANITATVAEPYSVPVSWSWAWLSDVTLFQEGPGILAKDFRNEGVALIRIAGMSGTEVSLEGCNSTLR